MISSGRITIRLTVLVDWRGGEAGGVTGDFLMVGYRFGGLCKGGC